MKPNYEKLVEINPRLENRPREEVERLIDAILEKGYIWDDEKQYFWHDGLRMHIRTQGLDVFNVERFEKAYRIWANPQIGKGYRAGSKSLKVLFLFFIDLIIGWVFIPTTIWLITLIVFLFAFFVLKRASEKQIKSGRDDLREDKFV